MKDMAKVDKVFKEFLEEAGNNLKYNDRCSYKQMNIDSLDLLEIYMNVEDELKIVLEDDELKNIETPNELKKLIKTKESLC